MKQNSLAMGLKDGCSYGKVNREMIKNIGDDFKEFRNDVKKEFSDIKTQNQELYNHLSSRLPPWATAIGAIGIAIVSSVIGIVIGRVL